MNKKFLQGLGIFIFWITWPGLWVLLRLDGSRSRVLVTHQDKILLLKPWLGAGTWTLPGGGVHYNEDVVVGACRELQEETGIIAKTSQLKELGTLKSAGDQGFRSTLVCYRLSLTSMPELRLQQREIAEAQWFDTSQLVNLRLGRATKHILTLLY